MSLDRAAALLFDGAHAEALALLRVTPAEDPIALDRRATLIHLCLARTHARGAPEDLHPDLGPETLAPTVVVACTRKSGSTFLASTLAKCLGFPLSHLFVDPHGVEQAVYPPRALAEARRPCVIHQHCSASAANLALLQALDARIVVLSRDLADSLVSLVDHLDKAPGDAGPLAPGWPSLSRAEKLEAVADQHGPWMVAFWASWTRAARAGAAKPLFLTYEVAMADKPRCIARISGHLGLPIAPERIETVLAAMERDKHQARFNQGRSGRGAEEMPAVLRQRLAGFIRPYPDVDFTSLGLGTTTERSASA